MKNMYNGPFGCGVIQLNILPSGDLQMKLIEKDDLPLALGIEAEYEITYLYRLMDNARLIGNGWDAVEGTYENGIGYMPIYAGENDPSPVDWLYVWYYAGETGILKDLEVNGEAIFKKS